MKFCYYVRYGNSGHVGRFASDEELEHGAAVLVRSPRGTEVGELLAPAGSATAGGEQFSTLRIIRRVTSADRENLEELERTRMGFLEEIGRVFEESVWPIQVIDVEVMYEGDRAILSYLGPHQLELDGLRESLLEKHGVSIDFEPVGIDPGPDEEEATYASGCTSCECGESSCGSGSGCGSCADDGGSNCRVE